MNENLEYLEHLLEQTRSITQAVPDRVDASTLNHQWEEALRIIKALREKETAVVTSGVAAIGARVAEIIENIYPAAELADDPLANNSSTVLFFADSFSEEYKSISLTIE